MNTVRMSAPILTRRNAEAWLQAVERAVAALRVGRLVVLPTETVYAISADAKDAQAVDALWKVKGPNRRGPIALHLPSSEALAQALRLMSGGLMRTHERMVRRLTPGPVTIAMAASPEGLAALRGVYGMAEGVVDDGARALFRVPARSVTRQIIEQSGGALVMGSMGGSRLARTAEEASEAIPEGAVELILDDGPVSFASTSTLIRLEATGGYAIEREGAMSAEDLRRALARTFLFVCTGNTCRSPMAAAIARAALEGRESEVFGYEVSSAGTSAGAGMEATPEAVDVLREMGIDLRSHESAPVSRRLLEESEHIFALTRSHLEAIRRISPESAGRAMLLDPAGGDIPDPIGKPKDVYARTAEAIRTAVQRRLGEILD